MTIQSAAFTFSVLAFIGVVFCLGSYASARFYCNKLLSKAAEIEALRGRLRSALQDVAEKRNEVIQLTRDVKGEIERGDALYVEVLKLRAFKAKRNLSAKQRRTAILIPATSPGAKVMAA